MTPSDQPTSSGSGSLALKADTWPEETIPENPQVSYYRARYYDPIAGRFINEDPIGFNAGINSYEYSLNNPNNLTDPTGFNPLTDYICKHLKPPNVPQYPPFESPTETQKVLQNMKTADPFINAYNLFQLVRNTGPWNYKHGNPNYDAAGNFNYGYACAEMGFDAYTCATMGSAYHSLYGTGHGSGIPFLFPPFGNTQEKYNEILNGYKYHDIEQWRKTLHCDKCSN